MRFCKELTISKIFIVASLIRQVCCTNKVNIQKDERFNFTQLAEKYFGACEQYDVVTEDGYILTIFRLDGRGNNSISERNPILLWHGIFDSADIFILRGLNSTGISLAKAGYDVWFGNVRGNKYSRRHKSLDPDKDVMKFWDFSFHEFGYYDLPATIDFILEKTGKRKLSAIGHSQGNMMYYILGSTRSEYNEKVQVLIALGPIAFLNHIRGLLSTLAPLWPVISGLLPLVSAQELFKDKSAANELIKFICTLEPLGSSLCKDGAVMSAIGNDSEELETEFFDVMLGHYPAGTSKKVLDHFYQFLERKTFSQYDYGAIQNFLKYGSMNPPDYPLSKVSLPVLILTALNDNLSTVEDAYLLKRELPNVAYFHVMDRKEFNHIDYVVAKNIDVYLNPLLKSLLKKYADLE